MVRRPWAAATVVALAVSGCAQDEVGPPPDLSPEAIAAVVAGHVDREPSEVSRWDVMARELEVPAPGAFLQFSRRWSLGVAVALPTDSELVCARPGFFDECVRFEHEGTDLLLGWQELEPEEDPGVVFVIDRRDDEDVVVSYGGVSITRDPRELDLGISLDAMADIAADERLTLG